jgi:hypothetical protein
MKKVLARLLLACYLFVQVVSFSSIATYATSSDETSERVNQGDQTEDIEVYEPPFESTLPKPYEIEIANVGKWFSTYFEEGRLAYGYKGDFSEMSEDMPWPQTFNVTQTTRLRTINIATLGMASDISEVLIQDAKGNVYGGLSKTTETMIGVKAVSNTAEDPDILISIDDTTQDQKKNTHILTPKNPIILPKGEYRLLYSASMTDTQINPFYITGYNESKYQRYLRDVDDERREWEKKNPPLGEEASDSDEDEFITEIMGDEDLLEWYESFIEGKDGPNMEDEEYYQPDAYNAPMFIIDTSMSLDQIILNTYNQGQGAQPGIISLYNEAGDLLAQFQAQGAGIGDVPNSLWVAFPEMSLDKGTYYIEMDNPQALSYDESDMPMFSVSLSTIKPPFTDFTGSYALSVDVTKTSTLMGNVTGQAPSFTLKNHPISVLDKGSSIEIIGTYEGMQFSQDCRILERTQDLVTCSFGFITDLRNLPYEAIIGAELTLTFKKTEPNSLITMNVLGRGTYSREATKTKGADSNEYAVIGSAQRKSEKLPPYIMAALAKLYGVGNIPGPNSPVEALVGLLFPPLLGVIITVVEGLIKAKDAADQAAMNEEVILSPGQKAMKDANNSLAEALGSKGKLSVGEQAMKDANNSLGQGLTSEKEKSAWKILAEALGNSGGDPEDHESMGDNEIPSGQNSSSDDYGNSSSDYEDTSSEYGDTESNKDFENNSDYTEPHSNETDLSKNQDSKSTGEPHKNAPLPTESAEQNLPEEPITAVVPTNTKGSTKLVQYDPKTNSWFDPESGSEYNHEKNMEFLAGEEKRLKDYHDRNDYLNETKQTAMDEYIKEFQNANKKLLNYDKMQKAKIKQEILEAELAEAKSGLSPLGILNQTKVNIIDELDEAANTVVDGVKAINNAIKDEIKSIKNDIKNDPDFWKNFTLGTLSDYGKIITAPTKIVTDPLGTLKKTVDFGGKVLETGANVVTNVYNGAKAVITDPAKAWEWIKDSTGYTDFANSQDMNKPLIDRIGNVLSGTVKLGTTIASLGQAKAAAEGLKTFVKGGATVVKNSVDDIAGALGKATSKPKLTGSGIQKNLTFTEKGTYITSKNPPYINGMPTKSVKTIQNISDDMGVRIQARPTTKYAKSHIESGNAIPKHECIKTKTADLYDEVLGAPKDAKGLTVIYEPKMPPESVMKNFTKETQDKIKKKFETRMKDFSNKDKLLADLKNNGYDLDDQGRIFTKIPPNSNNVKYVAGDNDIYDITNFDGSPLTEKQKAMVIKRLQDNKAANVLHDPHLDWNPSKSPTTYSAKTKAEISLGHTQNAGKPTSTPFAQEGEGLVTFNPLSKPTKSFQNGVSGLNAKEQTEFINALSKNVSSSNLTPAQQKAYMDNFIKNIKGGA